MNVSISIMAVRSRSAWVKELQRALGGAPVAWDEKRNVWDTRCRATMLYDPHADFHLVVQDDALLCQNFMPRVYAALERGEMAYSLYYRHKPKYADFIAAAKKGRKVGGFEWWRLQYGVGVVLPTSIIPDALEYGTSGPEALAYDRKHAGKPIQGRHDDLRLSAYLKSISMPVFYPLPSLVDHRPEGRGNNGSNAHRRAKWFDS